MRRQASLTDAQLLAADILGEIQAGDTTLVNGSATKAVWRTASLEKVNRYIREDELASMFYIAEFAPSVLQAPFNLGEGSSIVWQVTGYNAVVRGIEPNTDNDTLLAVWAVCILIPRTI